MKTARYPWVLYVFLTAIALTVSGGFTSFDPTTFRAEAAQQMVFKPQKVKSKPAPSDVVRLPEHIEADKVDDFMAALSDEQVRRLLIEALKKQAAEEAATATVKKEMTGIAGFIDAVRAKVDLIRLRIEELKASDAAKMTEIPSLYSYLGKGERDANSTGVIISAILVFLAAFFVEFLFYRYTAAVRRRIVATPPVDWKAKLSALGLRGLLDLVSICVFAAAVLAIFHLFLDRTMPQRVLVATYLAAVLIVRAAHLISRLLLAPRTPALRILPLGDETALYLHRWIMAIVAVGSFGLLTCGIFRLAGTPEAIHFIMISLVGLVLAIMLITMILQKRKPVMQALTANLPQTSLRARLALYWHHFAIFGVILLWIFSVLNRLLVGDRPGGYLGMKTLLIIPLYFLLDWILKRILEVAFGIVQKPDDLSPAAVSNETSDLSATTENETEGTESKTDAEPADNHLDIGRLKKIVRGGLRVALAFLMLFWIMRIWGVEFKIGEEVARAAFDILVVVLVCFVTWELVNAAIKRRLAKEMPEEDEDDEKEEGGSGGSRLATLLVLLRKFMLAVIIVLASLIILSSVGVDIGPLIAGAGVIGLAIGFGAQTLVKDIISGMFFLIDDAFRVGDYVNTGKQKGTVEKVSLRSLRLRHPRGMVYTIPFGDISMVTNFSRDYIITKLDFRVPFDTDLEQVRKLVKKKVYQKIMEDPEKLGEKLLGPIKSQGVRELDDSALIVRVKYKTAPGEQFAIRKQVYRLMQEAFQEAGLKFAHRNVTVTLPPEIEKPLAHADAETREKILEAGAAAAGAVIQAEEEQKEKESKA
ncbi:MAG: mechanosensitive ion channel domain-containing protein [Desulfobacterales bacterium]